MPHKISNKRIESIRSKPLALTATFDRAGINQDARTVPLAFSSEQPVEQWFGMEILDHSPGSVRLGRLSDGGPILMDHDRRDHVGVVESVSIDQDRRGRLIARFGKGARATEIFNDVVDGIRQKVSVGYWIYDLILEKPGVDGGADTYRVTDWEPYEVSLLSVPADNQVGVNRSASAPDAANNTPLNQEERTMPDTRPNTPPATPPAEPQQRSAPPAAPQPTVDVQQIETAARAAEQQRVKDILKIGELHDVAELSRQFIDNGQSVDNFRAAVLERKSNESQSVQTPVTVDMSERDHQRFSIVRALRASMTGDWKGAGFEREVSDAIAKQLNRSTDGVFVPTSLRTPPEIMQRAPLVAGTPAAGGYTVPTDTLGLIDILRNRMLVKQMGATVLSGLDGDLSFPRQNGTTVLYWVGENPGADVTESEASFDQVQMTPKTAQATTAYGRQLLAQSSLDVESFVRNDLIQINALGLDQAAINGSGAANQPLGILNTTGIGAVAGGTNGAAPTWANIVDLETLIADANADVGNIGYLTNSKVRGKLKTTEKAANTAQFIWGDNAAEAGFGLVNGYRAGVSNQVPKTLTKGTGSNLSAIIFGNWADLMIGEWGVIELIVDPYALKKQGLIEVTSIMMVDVVVRHAQSFAAMQDAITV